MGHYNPGPVRTLDEVRYDQNLGPQPAGFGRDGKPGIAARTLAYTLLAMTAGCGRHTKTETSERPDGVMVIRIEDPDGISMADLTDGARTVGLREYPKPVVTADYFGVSIESIANDGRKPTKLEATVRFHKTKDGSKILDLSRTKLKVADNNGTLSERPITFRCPRDNIP